MVVGHLNGQPGRKTVIQGLKIDGTRQCQLGRRFRPPETQPLSWHSFLWQCEFICYGTPERNNLTFVI